jgi:subtilisin family serine protease
MDTPADSDVTSKRLTGQSIPTDSSQPDNSSESAKIFDTESVDSSKISSAVKEQIGRTQSGTTDGSPSETESDIEGENENKKTEGEEELIPVIIVLEQQPEKALNVRNLPAQAARQNMKAFTQDRQAPVLNYLSQQKANGRAANMQPFWVRNIIAVEASPETITELTTGPRIDRIIYDQQISVLSESSNSSTDQLVEELGAYSNVSAAPKGFERVSTGDRAWSVEYVGADDVQERGITGEGVNVSVVDTGIEDDHPALDGQVVYWKDYVNTSNTEPIDPEGHGTHVAGTIAGRQDAAKAVGVAPGANLFGARVFNNDGSGQLSDALSAFEWSADNNADVISASFGVSPLMKSADSAGSEIEPGTVSRSNFSVSTSAENFSESDVSFDGFEPASVFVRVEPQYEDGSYIVGDERNQTRVMRNLSVTLVDPQGNEQLKRVEANWLFDPPEGSGQGVPDSIGVWKFKPKTSRPLDDGDYTLQIENNHTANISYSASIDTVYPTNGSGEMERFVNSLATTQDVVPVIAAGNAGIAGNRTLGSPGAAEEAITVGATERETNELAVFSSRGPAEYGNETRPGVDLIAPGTDVISTYPGYDGYASQSGTSMATPHVSGTVALLLEANHSMSRQTVRETLRSTAQDVPGDAGAVGAGALDTWAAVNATTNLGSQPQRTESDVNELFAGIGGSGDTSFIDFNIEPVTDPAGDAGNAPDIWAITGDPVDNFELATHNRTPANGTFDLYLDTDQSESTGDPDQHGAEFKVAINRTVDPATGVHSLSITEFEYNSSSQSYETTTNVTAGNLGDVQGNFFEFFDLTFANQADSDPFEWHVISSAPDTTDTDRIPDAGQQAYPPKQNVTGVAVAWNSTAGGPAVNESVTFSLYDDSNSQVGMETVETDHDGYARAEFRVPALDNSPYDDYDLEINDSHGNVIEQDLDFDNSDVEGGLVDTYLDTSGSSGDIGNFTVVDRDYEIPSNSTVQVNIPVYEHKNETMTPYQGPASIALTNYDGSEVYSVRNNLDVQNGVVRATFDLNETAFDDGASGYYYSDLRVALDGDFKNASATSKTRAGSVNTLATSVDDRYLGTRLGPTAAVTEPGSSATFSFQNVQRDDNEPNPEPANVSFSHETMWITDRHVAAFFEDLPSSTSEKIEQLRVESSTPDRPSVKLTKRDRAEIDEAFRNLSVSPQDTSRAVTTGVAPPTRRGVGTFSVTPPEDARFGFVTGTANTSEVNVSYASETPSKTVFVANRLQEFQPEPTKPQEETRYHLSVEGYWDQHVEGEFVVPNDTIDVQVALYDTQTDSLVDGADVRLYDTSGNVTTVTTSDSGPVTVAIQTPDFYWPTTDYDQREQQVVGIAEGYRTGDGKAVTDEEFFYDSVDRIETDQERSTIAQPRLGYENDSVIATVDYRDESWEPTNATRTLLAVTTPDWYETSRDLNVTFVDPPSGKTSVSYSFSDPFPSEERREYEARTRTGSEGFWSDDRTQVDGMRAIVDPPGSLSAGSSGSATVTIVDRNGNPVPDATVVWEYTEQNPFGEQREDGDVVEGDSALTQSNRYSPSSEFAGNTAVKTTDDTGSVSFNVSAPASDSEADAARNLQYRVGVATDSLSFPVVGSGSVVVTDEPPVNVTGRLFENGSGDPAVGDLVLADRLAGGVADENITASNGAFKLTVPDGTQYDLAYAQLHESKANLTVGERDGSVDIWPVDRRVADGNQSIGNHTLPAGYPVNVTVVDRNETAIENARVRIGVRNDATGADFVTPELTTRADGMIYPQNSSIPGFELRDNVTVVVRPPAESTRYEDEQIVKQIEVTGSDNVTIRLRDARGGNLVAEPTSALANVSTVNLTVTDISPPAIADEIDHYEWTFGDGETDTTSAAANETTHVYTLPGEHTITVKALDADGNVLFTAETTVSVTQASGNLSVEPETIRANVTQANFTLADVTPANLTDDADQHEWAFGDGATDTTLANETSHIYEQPGQYSATVRGIDSQDRVLYVASTTVTVTRVNGSLVTEPGPVYANYTRVNFTLPHESGGIGAAPSTASVSPNSHDDDTLGPAYYEWKFGDGSGNFTQHPNNATSHVYEQPGEYTASVQVLNEDEQPLFEAETTVTVVRAEGDLVVQPKEGLAGNTAFDFTLTNVSENVTPAMYDWEFGDGSGNSTQHPNNTTSHVYEQPGEYTASVQVLNEAEQPLLEAETDVTVSGPDVSTTVSAPADDQRIQDGVFADVEVTNEQTVPIDNVSVRLTASGAYWTKRGESVTENETVDLNASETKTLRIDLTNWALEDLSPYSYYSGQIQLLAQADPANDIAEGDETNNRDVNRTVATYSDLRTYTDTDYTGLVNESKEVTVQIRNRGTAATTENHTVTVDLGDGTTDTFEVGPLDRYDRVRRTFNQTYTDTGDYEIESNVGGDELFPRGNQSAEDFRIKEYDFSVDRVSVPYRVENGTQFRVWASYDTTIASDVNMTIETPDGLELVEDVDSNNRSKTDRSDQWGGSESWILKATNVTDDDADPYQINVTGEARGETDKSSDTTRVYIPKTRTTDQAAVVVSDDTTTNSAELTISNHRSGEKNTTITVRNETTYEHELAISVQAGAEGRTLQGLEYLFNYPNYCVEQTTSPMIAALETDQYYRNRTDQGSYDRQKVNVSVARGMARMSSGSNAQHSNGSWSMYGNDPSGDLFYTMYGFFGTTAVRNDPVQSRNTVSGEQDVSTSLAATDFNETVHWIRTVQNNETGALEEDGYFLDSDPAMTGFALIAIDQAGPFNSSTERVATDVRADAARYLVSSQDSSGSWDDGNTKTTAMAVWGLQSVADAGTGNQTLDGQVNRSIDDGTAWLLDAQSDSGAWTADEGTYWSSSGASSSATAWTLLALNETGVSAENESLVLGTEFLVNIYEEDGSWGDTESSALAIRALNRVGQGLGSVDRTVEVEIGDDDGPIIKTVSVNGTQNVVRLSLTKEELEQLRDGSQVKPISVNPVGGGTGNVIVAVNNDQVVNKLEYRENQQELGLLDTTSNGAGLALLAEDDGGDQPFSVSVDTPANFSTGDSQTLSVTVTNHDETDDMLSPIVEIPLTSNFDATKPLSATARFDGTERRIRVKNSTITTGDAITVYGREVPAGESRTYDIDLTVPSPGDMAVQVQVKPMYNESLTVNTTETIDVSGVGSMNVEVVNQSNSRVTAANISIGNSETEANAVSRDLTEGTYKVKARTNSTVFPDVDVPLSSFGTANVSFVTPPPSLEDPALVAQTGEGIRISGGSTDRSTLAAANATTAEKSQLVFNVSTSAGGNKTAVIQVNESVERAFRENGSRSISVESEGGEAEVISEDPGRDGNATTLTINTNGEARMNITYKGNRLGDVNGDDNVTGDDAETIASDVASSDVTSEYGDVNNDGQVTAADAMIIAQREADNRGDDYRRSQ